MEYLIKQLGAKHSRKQNKEESSRERKIPPQKTSSFKGEKKRPQNWFRRQLSGQMSLFNDTNEIEQAAAIAATAYAITTEESSIQQQKKPSEGHGLSLTPIKSKKERKFSILETGAEHSDSKTPETATTDEKIPVEVVAPAPSIRKALTSTDKAAPSMKKTPTFTDEPAPAVKKTPTFTDKPASSMKKSPTFTDEPTPSMKKTTVSDKASNNMKNKKPAELKTDLPATKPEITVPKPDWSAITKPATPTSQTQQKSSTGPGEGGTKAEAWERVELAIIKTRYDMLNEKILAWENKKKTKAKNRQIKTERELERRRLKALEQLQSDMKDIEQIAGGARAKAEERQRNEQLKVKEKVNKIRKTGEVPRTCFCF